MPAAGGMQGAAMEVARVIVETGPVQQEGGSWAFVARRVTDVKCGARFVKCAFYELKRDAGGNWQTKLASAISVDLTLEKIVAYRREL